MVFLINTWYQILGEYIDYIFIQYCFECYRLNIRSKCTCSFQRQLKIAYLTLVVLVLLQVIHKLLFINDHCHKQPLGGSQGKLCLCIQGKRPFQKAYPG